MSELAGDSGPFMLIRPRAQDKRILTAGDGLCDGLHIDAKLPRFMSGFVNELGMPFFVDPSTYVFALHPDRVLNKDEGGIRTTVAELARAYGAPFKDVVGSRALNIRDFPKGPAEMGPTVMRVLQYQKDKCAGQMNLPFDSYYSKYSLYASDDDTGASANRSCSPFALVPPYFPFRSTQDPWYPLNLELLDWAIKLRQRDDRVFAALLLAPEILDSRSETTWIIENLRRRDVNGVLVWVNGMKEERESKERLKSLANFCAGLSGRNRPVFKLFGGYFSLLSYTKGLMGFTCGLGYGASKNAYAYGAGKGGPMTAKFYVPRLHRSLELADAERLLREYSDLRCNCKICRGLYGNDLDQFSQMAKEGRCESHFLNARRSEMKLLKDKGLDACLKEMKATTEEFDSNPLVDVGPLRIWSDVLKVECPSIT